MSAYGASWYGAMLLQASERSPRSFRGCDAPAHVVQRVEPSIWR